MGQMHIPAKMDTSKYDIIDLGCGREKHEDALGVDIVETSEVDLIQDLNKADWALPDSSFSKVYCKDIIEHVDDPLNFLEEVYRISKPSAEVYIRTPHFTNNNAWADPTHKRPFSAFTFKDYVVEDGQYSYYTDANFRVEDFIIRFPIRHAPWNLIGRYIANNHVWFYENTVLRSLFPASSMEVSLVVVK